MRVVIVGPGRVGTALHGALTAAGETVLGLVGRAPYPAALASADVIIVAVPDPVVSEVGDALASVPGLKPTTVVLHTAGALGPDALGANLGAKAHRGTFHPLQTFPVRGAVPPLSSVPFALAGDELALSAGRHLAEKLGGVPLEVPAESRPLYHAAAVLACGHLATLAGAAARSLAPALGIPEDEALRLLAPILRETVANVQRLGLPEAITGPVARGDRETIDRNRTALASLDPRLGELYDALAAVVSSSKSS